MLFISIRPCTYYSYSFQPDTGANEGVRAGSNYDFTAKQLIIVIENSVIPS